MIAVTRLSVSPTARWGHWSLTRSTMSRRRAADVHLLAAVELTPGATLWTYDKRLHQAAEDLSLAAARG